MMRQILMELEREACGDEPFAVDPCRQVLR